MKHLNVIKENGFNDLHLNRLLVHDSPYFKILNFNLKEGQELPIHSHDVEGELSIYVMEGEGLFLAKDKVIPATEGDILICDIAEPHGIRAIGKMRVLVTIAPPI